MNIAPYTYLIDAMQLVESITIADEELAKRLNIADLQDVFPAATISLDKSGGPPISIEAIGFDYIDVLLVEAMIRAMGRAYTTYRTLRLDRVSLLAYENAWPISGDRVLSLVEDEAELTESQIGMLNAIADLNDDELTYHYLTHHRARIFGAAESCGIGWGWAELRTSHEKLLWQKGYANALRVPQAELKALVALDVLHHFSVVQVSSNGELGVLDSLHEEEESARCDVWELRLDKNLWALEKAYSGSRVAV